MTEFDTWIFEDRAGDLVAGERVSLRLSFVVIALLSAALWGGIIAVISWVIS